MRLLSKNRSYKVTSVFMLFFGFLISCNSDFMGSGAIGGGSDGGKRFSGNDSNPVSTGTSTATSTGTGIDNGDNPFGEVISGPGIDTRTYKPLLVNVLRRDCSSGNSQGSGCDGGSDDQSNVSLQLRVVGAKETFKGDLPGESFSTTIERACPDNETVKIEIAFVIANPAGRYKPNKEIKGGPIGFRRDEKTIWIGFEKDEVGLRSNYHNNDDLVIELHCESSKRIEVKNLCLDQSIPAAAGKRGGKSFSGPGSDLVTDELTLSDSEYTRKCTGT